MSMGVISDGSYDSPKDVIFSFPVTCKDGKWTIVQVCARGNGMVMVCEENAGAVHTYDSMCNKQGLEIDERSAKLLKVTGDELVEELALAQECLKDL